MINDTQADFVAIWLALFVILILGVVLKYVLRNKTEAVRHIPLMVVAGSLLILEVVKQVYHIIYGDWNPWHIPLHFCSYFLVWYGVALFSRGGIRQTMYACSLNGGILVSILLLIAPRMILHSATTDILGCFNHFHTFVYHVGVMAYSVWLIMLNVYHPNRQHVIRSVIFHTILFFCTIAGAHIFHENYTNVLYADINLMENLRLSAGQFTYTCVLLLVGVIGISIVANATYFVMNKLYQKNLNKQKLTLEN